MVSADDGLRAEVPDGKLVVVWDGAPYHRAKAVWAAATGLGIELAPLPGLQSRPDAGRGAVALAARGTSPTTIAMPLQTT